MSNPANPPAPPVLKPPTHATYIPDRRPQWKYHKNIGQAKNACTHMARDSWMYEIDSTGNLVELYHLNPNDEGARGKYGYGWSDDYIPWKNTADEKRRKHDQRMREISRQIDSHKEAIERLRAELSKEFLNG